VFMWKKVGCLLVSLCVTLWGGREKKYLEQHAKNFAAIERCMQIRMEEMEGHPVIPAKRAKLQLCIEPFQLLPQDEKEFYTLLAGDLTYQEKSCTVVCSVKQEVGSDSFTPYLLYTIDDDRFLLSYALFLDLTKELMQFEYPVCESGIHISTLESDKKGRILQKWTLYNKKGMQEVWLDVLPSVEGGTDTAIYKKRPSEKERIAVKKSLSK
jgi:hypothetical protein